MTGNSVKFNDIHSKKSLFNSSFVYQSQLNKSRSLLQRSVISCNLKANNIELAKTLAANEVELSELRKENTKLLKENYDLSHTGQFRSYNCDSFMTKFYELTDITMTLFNEVCKLSDSLLQLQNHPFVSGENSGDTLVNQQIIVPSPFTSRDKIMRSPTRQSLCNTTSAHPVVTAEALASCVNKVKDQLSYSIHNLSINPEIYVSILNKSMNKKTDNVKSDNEKNLKQNPDKAPLNKSFFSTELNSSRNFFNTSINENEKESKILFRAKKKVPKSSPEKKKTKKSNRKPNKMKLRNEPNKEEHKKRVEKDAFYLSQNETINCTVVAPTYNEFKKSQSNTKSESNKENIVQNQSNDNENKRIENLIKEIPPPTNSFFKIIDLKKPDVPEKKEIDVDKNVEILNLSDITVKKPKRKTPKKTTTKQKPAPKTKKVSKISDVSPIKQVTGGIDKNNLGTEEPKENNEEKIGRRKRAAVNYKLSPINKKKK